ncbi:hypothetical protein Agabi119p4_10408 [Agaricus bisporus var. burnettii]|uniref:Uncharacterized protein n=1 Tax=Agaricus bisporus var. burnettii TaxID=192524 RepID=A0A8H7C3K4_AGABI|nr:hypothetical protein Agabi119p4_10408 [Agaricus bisporus var. burnettii]
MNDRSTRSRHASFLSSRLLQKWRFRTNKCARYNSFHIQSNTENAQLGARLSFNYFGQFYACGSGEDVWYKTTSSEGPGDCTAIDLYTVPVI